MSLLLTGCGGGYPTSSGSSSPVVTPESSAAVDGTTGRPSASRPPPRGDVTDDTDDTDDNPSPDGAGVGLEVPEAPEPTVESLAELLGAVRTAPLVAPQLPRAASARGRLVTRFPPVLRPTRDTRVETSSIAPSGDRLQVALVASTSLAPEDVLVAYRTRLAGRGLVEQAALPTTTGSQAAAFRRGRSTVTVSVTSQGTGTRYSVLASLHTGGE